MNAYEVAKELSKFMTEDEYTDLDKAIFMASNLLRIQAHQIEMLTKAKDDAQNGLETAINFSKTLIEKYK